MSTTTTIYTPNANAKQVAELIRSQATRLDLEATDLEVQAEDLREFVERLMALGEDVLNDPRHEAALNYWADDPFRLADLIRTTEADIDDLQDQLGLTDPVIGLTYVGSKVTLDHPGIHAGTCTFIEDEIWRCGEAAVADGRCEQHEEDQVEQELER